MKQQKPKKVPAALRKLRLAAFRARAAIEPAMAATAKFVVETLFGLKGNPPEPGRGTINRFARETREAEHRAVLYADTPKREAPTRQMRRAELRAEAKLDKSKRKVWAARMGVNVVYA